MFERDKYYTGPVLTEAWLAKFERHHGIRFPESLRVKLLELNGGRFPKAQFKFKGKIAECPQFFAVTDVATDLSNTFESLKAIVDRCGEYGQLSDPLGDLAKVFLFSEEIGCNHFALNFNDQPVSVWYIFLDTDGTGTAQKAAPSWDAFLAMQYDGDEKPTVDMLSGWTGYKILFKEEQSGMGDEIRRSILGLKGSTLRCQSETRTGETWDIHEVEWEAAESTACVQFEGKRVAVRIAGHGQHTGKSCNRKDGKWVNVEEDTPPEGTAYFESLEDALLLFKEIDRLSIRFGLSARRAK